jgi:hypothetical protein
VARWHAGVRKSGSVIKTSGEKTRGGLAKTSSGGEQGYCSKNHRRPRKKGAECESPMPIAEEGEIVRVLGRSQGLETVDI